MERVFGPVPSRRLGRSLGINNIPPKICSFSCVYCQIGRSTKILAERQQFYKPEDLADEVFRTVETLLKKGEKIDYLSFVPDGEPTLDINLGKIIDLIKPLGIKIAVITNSSLIFKPDVQQDLSKADWVSVKVDSVKENIWRKIDRPHRHLSLEKILEGIIEFSENYKGMLVSETMLVKDLNDDEDNLCKTSMFISEINVQKAYILVPTRPPAETWVQPADEIALNKAYQIFKQNGVNVEFLISAEGIYFGSTGDVRKDILSITAVHPMTKVAVQNFLKENNSDWSVIEDLISEGLLKKVEFDGNEFFIRVFKKRQS